MRRPPLPTDQPLLVLLLPTKLEDFALRERVEDLLRAPGAIAVEPPPVSWKKLGSLPEVTLARIAKRQAKRMKLPGIPRAIAVFEDTQRALAQREVLELGGQEEDEQRLVSREGRTAQARLRLASGRRDSRSASPAACAGS